MAKDMEKLNEVYKEILGEGEPLVEEVAEEATGTNQVDGAYVEEDYTDDAGDGDDPREKQDDDLLSDGEDDDDGYDDDDGVDDDGDDDDGEEVPQRLVEAGLQANLSDDAITELLETRPEVLEAMARAFEVKTVIPESNSDSKEKNLKGNEENLDGFKPIKFDFDEDEIEEMGSKAVGIIGELTKTVNELGKKVENQSQTVGNVEKQREVEQIRQIDAVFDELSKDVPELGQTASLSEKEKQNRIFAFRAASAASEVFGETDMKKVLAIGANALKGQQTEARVKEKLISDLDKRKKQFIGRGKSRKKPERKKSVEERAMSAINRVLDSSDY
jgi:hypothetical protein